MLILIDEQILLEAFPTYNIYFKITIIKTKKE